MILIEIGERYVLADVEIDEIPKIEEETKREYIAWERKNNKNQSLLSDEEILKMAYHGNGFYELSDVLTEVLNKNDIENKLLEFNDAKGYSDVERYKFKE